MERCDAENCDAGTLRDRRLAAGCAGEACVVDVRHEPQGRDRWKTTTT